MFRRTSQPRRIAALTLIAGLTVAACSSGGSSNTQETSLDTLAATVTLLPSPETAVAAPASPPPIAPSPATLAPSPVSAAPATSPAASTASPTTAPPPTAAPTAPPTVPSVPVDAGAPAVDAAAYAVYDMTADRWLAGGEADTPRPVGSLMKLLTAHVVMQAGDPTHIVTVPALGLDPMESVIGLYQGEQLQRDLLVRAMLIVSANDAAKALAIDLAGSEEAFAAQMNDAAAALALTGTSAANARGLDAEGAHSTATDMTRLAAVLLQDPTFRETVMRTDAKLHDQVFPATNDLLTSYPGAIGVKTGRTTAAGWCLVGAAERDGRTIVVTVLGSSGDAARVQAASTLLDWAFAQPTG
jgi:serine-type D-Ala-D-Ala carboxypeptidase (penicillin-binding protein 5/6)